MPRTPRVVSFALVGAAASLLMLSGCTVSTPAPAVTVTVTPGAAAPAPTESSSPTKGPVASPPKPPAAPPAGSPKEPTDPQPPHTMDDPCLRDKIKGEWVVTESSAGHAHGVLNFQNISGSTCEMEGFPRVWFQDDTTADAIGLRAAYDYEKPSISFDLLPGAWAWAPVTITQAGIMDGCTIVTSSSFLVVPTYPVAAAPWQTVAEKVQTAGIPACSNPDIGLILVGVARWGHYA